MKKTAAPIVMLLIVLFSPASLAWTGIGPVGQDQAGRAQGDAGRVLPGLPGSPSASGGQEIPYPFGDPAGCAAAAPQSLTEMVAGVQDAIGSEYDLGERRRTSVWNGEAGGMVDVSKDGFAFEFVFDEFQHPFTYRGDRVATIFLTHGFAVWFRQYDGAFRLLAVPMLPGVQESRWGGYVRAYWQKNGAPNDDRIYPVMKKLPCHWMIERGYANPAAVRAMFALDWGIPDYMAAGRPYLAQDCQQADRIAREKIGAGNASTMCGPLAWTLMRDANAYPYRIGSWNADAKLFNGANPKWNGMPWGGFDPETYRLARSDRPLAGFDFGKQGDLYPGDLVYAYSPMNQDRGGQYFDHIFLVAGLGAANERLSVSNMVSFSPGGACSIREIILYAPKNRDLGVIDSEWNGGGFGITGASGFDVFRWNWITYHIEGKSIAYLVRWGDTLETIAFDWKVSPESILAANRMETGARLTPGQNIVLPVPQPFEVQKTAGR